LGLAIGVTIVLGIALSLVPRHVAISSENYSGKAVGNSLCIDFLDTKLGLMGVPLLIGLVLNSANPTVYKAKKW
jgi:hypothetical protein